MSPLLPGDPLAVQLQDEYNASHAKSEARYALLKLKLSYIQNRQGALPPKQNGLLIASKEVVSFGEDVGEIESVVREDNVITSASNAELRYMPKLALAEGTGEAKLSVPIAGSITLEAGRLPDIDDAVVDAGDAFVNLSVRQSGPNPSVGIQTIQKWTTVSQLRLEAKINESTVEPQAPGGTLAYRPIVEWTATTSTNAQGKLFVQGAGFAHTLTDPVRDLSQIVKVGDFVQLVANGATTDMAPNGKFFKVTAVGIGTLVLTTKAWTKMPDGTYAEQSLDHATYDSSYDFKVIRTRTEALYLRDATKAFGGVQAGDWLHATWTDSILNQTFSKVFKVLEVAAPGLLILEKIAYTGAKAPYGSPASLTAGDYFTESAVYKVTRAPGTLAYFRLTHPVFLGTDLRPGDFVRFLPRTGLIDPTANAAVVAGAPYYYRITSVSDTQLTFAQTRYTLQGDLADYDPQPQFVSAGNWYTDINTFIDFEGYRVDVGYPHATLYKITDVVRQGGVPVSYALQRAYYDGYGGLSGQFSQRPTVVPQITDHYDVEAVRVYHNKLLLHHPTGNFETRVQPPGATTDFVHVNARTSAPATGNPATTVATYAVTEVPRPNILFLQPVRYGGTKPRYVPVSGFLPGVYFDPCDYRVTRVHGEYRSLKLTNGHPDARAGDFIQVQAGPDAAKGYWKVTGVAAGVLTLDRTKKYTLTGTGEFDDVAIDPDDVDTFKYNTTYKLWRKSTETTSLMLNDPAVDFTTVGNVPPIPGAGEDVNSGYVVTLSYGPDGNRKTEHYLIILGDGFEATLWPTPLTLGANGTYKMGSNPISRAEMTNVDYTVWKATGEYGTSKDKLDYLRDVVLPQERTQGMDKVFSLLTESKDIADLQGVLTSSVRQALRLTNVSSFDFPAEAPLSGGAVQMDALLADIEGVALTMNLTEGYLSVLKNHAYAAGLAYACAIDFKPIFDEKLLKDMKDYYVESELLTRGYTDWLAYIGNSANPTGAIARKQLRARALAGQAIARKYTDAVSAALQARGRGALESSIRVQIDNLLQLVKTSILPAGYANPNRFFVEPGKVDLRDDFIAQLLGLPFIPGFTLGQIREAETNDDPKPRRDAIKGMIGVPADRSVRGRRRSHALHKNRQKFLQRMGDDLQRHIDTATNPGLKTRMEGFFNDMLGWKDTAANAAQEVIADIAEPLQATFIELQNLIDPNNGQQVAVEAEKLEEFESEGLLPSVTVAPSVADAAAKTVTLTTQDTTPAKPAAADRLIITNLFTNDFNDFRKTGIAVGIDVFDADVTNPSNRTRLASLYLTDLEDNIVTGFNLRGSKAGTFSGERYNQFMLTTVQESYAEKFQVQDTLGEGFVASTFGERPEVWSIAGVLINDVYSDQASKFRELWHNFIRATKLAKGKRKLAIDVPAAGLLIVGFPVNLTMTTDAGQNEKVVPFSMQILISRTYRKPLINLASGAEQKIPAGMSNVPAGGSLQRAIESQGENAQLTAEKDQQSAIVHKLQMEVKNATAPVARATAAAKLANPARALERVENEIVQRALPFPL